MHVMIDLETLGLANDAVILSIGAVKFEPSDFGGIGSELFHVALDTKAQEERGRRAYADTAKWWLTLPENAQTELLSLHEVPVEDALIDLGAFCEGAEGVWGNGAMFDNALVISLAASFEMPRPWSHKLDRCYRTLKGMVDAPRPDFEGTPHNALDDARFQAAHLQKIYKLLGL